MLDDLAVTLGPDRSAEVVLPEGWSQGRWVFGGLLGLVLVRAADSLTPRDRQLRSATVSFVAPVRAGAVRLEADVLRQGRGVTHVSARLLQPPPAAAPTVSAGPAEASGPVEPGLCATALLTYGVPREDSLRLPSLPPPEVPGPEGIADLAQLPGGAPEFLSNFAVRWTVGSLPFSGTQARVQGWVRPRRGGQVDAAGLLALLDSWPPPLLSAADSPFAATSLSWQTAISDAFSAGPVGEDSWWLYDASAAFGGHGYSDLEARMWDREGTLLACSRQVYADFSAP